MGSTPIQHSVLNVKAAVAAFNHEKALVGAFSVIANFRMELFEALATSARPPEECDQQRRRAVVSRLAR